MALTVTVLGCSGSFPGPGDACSGYLLRSDGGALWIDAGPGTMANLQRHIPLADVSAVIVTHGHHDHFSDLPSYQVAAKYWLEREGIPVYAPGHIAGFFRQFQPTFEVREVTGGDEAHVGPFALRFSHTDHYIETLAVRVDAGARSFGYTADTGPGWSPAALGGGMHTLLSEATFLAADECGALHLSGRQAGIAATEAGVERLLLTHTQPGVDRAEVRAEAMTTFDGEVITVAENEEYDA